MNTVAHPTPPPDPDDISSSEWATFATRAPLLTSTFSRYLTQVATFLASSSVVATEGAMRQFARWITDATDITAVADITRSNIEDYKVWLAAQPGAKTPTLAPNTQRQRLRMIKIFFERIIEWDWDDAPRRNPILHGDIPPRTEPLPKFLDDRDAAKLIAAARNHPDQRTRLVIEMLARTGLRASELCDLAADSVTQIGGAHWLRVPVGKLRNDRFIPLHPDLVTLLAEWTATHSDHIRAQRRLIADHHAPICRRAVYRIVATVAKQAGIHAHPHQLRHTLATQAINRGMRLEAIAALLGHRSMEMTLTYARIADRVVADEYEAVTAQIDALYKTAGTNSPLPADIETAAMTRLRNEAHARMLGNGLCTRPVELECRMESACETCAYFATGPQFIPVLLRQRDHATAHQQPDRAVLFDTLIQRAETTP